MEKIWSMLRYPAVSQEHLAFVHGGDLWVIEKEEALIGGVATKLTTAAGRETRPRFSPDGQQIAFSGNYGGSIDVYVIPTAGGVPRRLTHHPKEDQVVDWFCGSEGEVDILYASAMESPFPGAYQQLFRVAPEGGMPRKLPLTSAAFGRVSPAGVLAFQESDPSEIPQRRVRGGRVPQIYLVEVDGAAELPVQLTGVSNEQAADSNFHPVWSLDGTRLFFLSNRHGQRNSLWYFEHLDLQKLREGHLPEPRPFYSCKDAPIQFPAVGPREVVFEIAGNLYLRNLEGGEAHRLNIQVPGDRRQHMVQLKNASTAIQSWDVSPQGKRVVFEARGHLFTVPVANGPIRQLTAGSGVAHRTPSWSPDGQWIAYFTDRCGEYQLALRPSDGRGEEQILTTFSEGFRYRPFWSPDSRKLAFLDHRRRISICELNGGPLSCKATVREVDELISWLGLTKPQSFRISWSPCSRYIAYAGRGDFSQDAIHLWDTKAQRGKRLTSGYYPDQDPVFCPSGDYIFFQTARKFSPVSDERGSAWAFEEQYQIAALPLRREVSPLFVVQAEEEIERGPAAEQTPGPCDGVPAKGLISNDTPIDFDEELEPWLQLLPKLNPGKYRSLHAIHGKLLMMHSEEGRGQHPEIIELDLETGEQRFVKERLPHLREFTVSADGLKILCCVQRSHQSPTFLRLDTSGPADQTGKEIQTDPLQVQVEPRAEWLQIFNDVWRILRDYFFDAELNGLDWEDRREVYRQKIERAATRWDVNQLLDEMAKELGASHTGVSLDSGDVERPAERTVGLLGADFQRAGCGFQIKRVLRGAPWDSAHPSPLHHARMTESSVLTAIDGISMSQVQNPWEALEGREGQVVELSFRKKSGARMTRTLVRTISAKQERRLRYLGWLERNRRFVAKRHPDIAYIHIPNVLKWGLVEFYRQLSAQRLRGFIFDARMNSGGFTPESFLQLIGQENLGTITYAGSHSSPKPILPTSCHRVLLINEWTTSWGELLAHGFQQQGLGDLVGTTTRGAGIGMGSTPTLVDGGLLWAASLPVRDASGDILVEGNGVPPTVQVDQDAAYLSGEDLDPAKDSQLCRAIELIAGKLSSPKFP